MAEPTQVPESYYSDLKSLQAIDFTLVELTLYLDTHPNDLDALKQFNSAAKKVPSCAKDLKRGTDH